MMVRTRTILWGIFVFVLTIRLLFAFSLPNFTYESYFHLRQVEEIVQTGFPQYQDALSYGGRTYIFLPLFHYVMALFTLLFPLSLVAKIMPNVLLALLIPLAYLMSRQITKDEIAGLLSAFTIGFLPVIFVTNTFTPLTLFYPLLFLTMYAFLRIQEKRYLFLYITSFFLLALTSPAAFLVMIGFGIYLLLSYTERKVVQRAEVELILFSLFLYVWIEFLFFKNSLIQEGVLFIWQNIPASILINYFAPVSISTAVIGISIIPLITGLYVVYKSLFEWKSSALYFLISIVISTTILAFLRLVETEIALALGGMAVSILFALFYENIITLMRKTKWSHHSSQVGVLLAVAVLVTTGIPAVVAVLHQEMPTIEEMNAFQWLAENTPERTTIAAPLEEGHLVTGIAERKNIMDDNFALMDDVDKRFRDINYLFTTPFQTLAISIFDDYDVDYLILTPRAKKVFNVTVLPYRGSTCFEKIYGLDNITIYNSKCTLQKVQI